MQKIAYSETEYILTILSKSLIYHPFSYRQKFFGDVDELRAQERARHDARRMEVLERRQKQIDDVAQKKQASG